MTKRLDLAGMKFGRLAVLGLDVIDSSRSRRKSRWLCLCDCGEQKVVSGTSLVQGVTKSCGCLSRETAAQNCSGRASHGAAREGMRFPEYGIWMRMRLRCENPEHHNYRRYGARGISVCPQWASFQVFYADMGPRPSPQHSIDRKNNDGNYEPGNCRWVTAIVQANNRSSNRYVLYRGKAMSLRSALRLAGDVVGKSTARLRIVKWGWPVERAVETPPEQQKRVA